MVLQPASSAIDEQNSVMYAIATILSNGFKKLAEVWVLFEIIENKETISPIEDATTSKIKTPPQMLVTSAISGLSFFKIKNKKTETNPTPTIFKSKFISQTIFEPWQIILPPYPKP